MYSLGNLMRYILAHFSSTTIKKKKVCQKIQTFISVANFPFLQLKLQARAARAEEGDFIVCRCLKPNTITLNNKLNRKPGCVRILQRGLKEKKRKKEKKNIKQKRD